MKARRLTQQSLVSLESERERAVRVREERDTAREREHAEQLGELRRQLACARDTEQNQRVELQERSKDYADAVLRGDQLRPLQAELRALRDTCAELGRKRDQVETDITIMQRERDDLQSRVEVCYSVLTVLKISSNIRVSINISMVYRSWNSQCARWSRMPWSGVERKLSSARGSWQPTSKRTSTAGR